MFPSISLQKQDPLVYQCIEKELERQRNGLELIASENIVSHAVLEAQGSILTNKYAEGYPGKRYYGGCEYVDEVERIAIARAKQLFQAEFVNVQPHSGTQANQAVFMALLKPNDCILGLSLDCGGHLTHGSKVSQSGKWFSSLQYGVHRETGAINYEEVSDIAQKHKPKLIIAGCSAYPRFLDFKRFREIADSIGAYLMVDMAHFAGLVAAGFYENPMQYAHVVTTTTHKTLRGPRGGMILTSIPEIAKSIDSAIFPGIQGGPLMHVIAAKAVAFGEALQPEYTNYIEHVVSCAKAMSEELIKRGYDIFTNGTDTHLFLVDLRAKKLTGKLAEQSLEKSGLTCNKNSIAFDEQKPTITSGIRIGTPAIVSRGFGVIECQTVANLIADVLDGLIVYGEDNTINENKALLKVKELCAAYPIYI